MNETRDCDKGAALLAFALQAGATKAKLLPPESVVVEDRLADFCRDPRCPHFGQAMSCPPHVSGPEGLRKLLRSCRHVLVFRIEIQAASLHGEDRPVVMRLLHETAAKIEIEAKRLGFTEAAGFAGGSCKPSFCAEHPDCRVIAGQGACRYPELARPSMSGFGVHVGALMKAAGWTGTLFGAKDGDGGEQLAWVAGLILLR